MKLETSSLAGGPEQNQPHAKVGMGPASETGMVAGGESQKQGPPA